MRYTDRRNAAISLKTAVVTANYFLGALWDYPKKM
jgi:hypothetical protein